MLSDDESFYGTLKIKCDICDDAGWVCEAHPDTPWAGTSSRGDACDCGGAGMPCDQCNPCDEAHPPQKTGMIRIIVDKDGFRH